jgi:hypothetical protein
MKLKNTLLRSVIGLCLLCAAWPAAAQDKEEPTAAPGEEVILQRNRVLTQTLAIAGTQPATIVPQRSFAMLHLAMLDAVNSIDRTYTPYLTDVKDLPTASPTAAAAQAAHNVLAALYPTQIATFDTELADSLIGIRRGAAGPGNWQPTPPANAAAFTHFPGVTPFALTQATQFLPAPPPALTSAEYAADFNEVKEVGIANSATRTADQTMTAQVWANGAATDRNFNNLVRTLALNRNNSTVENARLFALYYLASHDSLQTSFTAKYVYGLWRPITAIRRADEDGNPDTSPNATWTSLNVSPPHPTYVSNAAAVRASLATMMALFFGRDDISFQVNFGGTPNVIRNYPSFAALSSEVARSRVYGGIHFNFDSAAGQSIGRNVANFVFQNYLTPRRCNVE